MRKLEICKKKSQLGENNCCTIIYYVIIDELSNSTSGTELETYGVGITICESGESATIPNVTFNVTEILKLSELLANNLVTPATVYDVIEDWLCA
jgi:hypothetical protein